MPEVTLVERTLGEVVPSQKKKVIQLQKLLHKLPEKNGALTKGATAWVKEVAGILLELRGYITVQVKGGAQERSLANHLAYDLPNGLAEVIYSELSGKAERTLLLQESLGVDRAFMEIMQHRLINAKRPRPSGSGLGEDLKKSLESSYAPQQPAKALPTQSNVAQQPAPKNEQVSQQPSQSQLGSMPASVVSVSVNPPASPSVPTVSAPVSAIAEVVSTAVASEATTIPPEFEEQINRLKEMLTEIMAKEAAMKTALQQSSFNGYEEYVLLMSAFDEFDQQKKQLEMKIKVCQEKFNRFGVSAYEQIAWSKLRAQIEVITKPLSAEVANKIWEADADFRGWLENMVKIGQGEKLLEYMDAGKDGTINYAINMQILVQLIVIAQQAENLPLEQKYWESLQQVEGELLGGFRKQLIQLYKEMPIEEWRNAGDFGKTSVADKTPHFYAMSQFCNKITMWAVNAILGQSNQDECTLMLGMVVDMAYRAIENGDYLTAKMLYGAVKHSALSKLGDIFAGLPELMQKKIEEMNKLFYPDMENLDAAISKCPWAIYDSSLLASWACKMCEIEDHERDVGLYVLSKEGLVQPSGVVKWMDRGSNAQSLISMKVVTPLSQKLDQAQEVIELPDGDVSIYAATQDDAVLVRRASEIQPRRRSTDAASLPSRIFDGLKFEQEVGGGRVNTITGEKVRELLPIWLITYLEEQNRDKTEKQKIEIKGEVPLKAVQALLVNITDVLDTMELKLLLTEVFDGMDISHAQAIKQKIYLNRIESSDLRSFLAGTLSTSEKLSEKDDALVGGKLCLISVARETIDDDVIKKAREITSNKEGVIVVIKRGEKYYVYGKEQKLAKVNECDVAEFSQKFPEEGKKSTFIEAASIPREIYNAILSRGGYTSLRIIDRFNRAFAQGRYPEVRRIIIEDLGIVSSVEQIQQIELLLRNESLVKEDPKNPRMKMFWGVEQVLVEAGNKVTQADKAGDIKEFIAAYKSFRVLVAKVKEEKNKYLVELEANIQEARAQIDKINVLLQPAPTSPTSISDEARRIFKAQLLALEAKIVSYEKLRKYINEGSGSEKVQLTDSVDSEKVADLTLKPVEKLINDISNKVESNLQTKLADFKARLDAIELPAPLKFEDMVVEIEKLLKGEGDSAGFLNQNEKSKDAIKAALLVMGGLPSYVAELESLGVKHVLKDYLKLYQDLQKNLVELEQGDILLQQKMALDKKQESLKSSIEKLRFDPNLAEVEATKEQLLAVLQEMRKIEAELAKVSLPEFASTIAEMKKTIGETCKEIIKSLLGKIEPKVLKSLVLVKSELLHKIVRFNSDQHLKLAELLGKPQLPSTKELQREMKSAGIELAEAEVSEIKSAVYLSQIEGPFLITLIQSSAAPGDATHRFQSPDAHKILGYESTVEYVERLNSALQGEVYEAALDMLRKGEFVAKDDVVDSYLAKCGYAVNVAEGENVLHAAARMLADAINGNDKIKERDASIIIHFLLKDPAIIASINEANIAGEIPWRVLSRSIDSSKPLNQSQINTVDILGKGAREKHYWDLVFNNLASQKLRSLVSNLFVSDPTHPGIFELNSHPSVRALHLLAQSKAYNLVERVKKCWTLEWLRDSFMEGRSNVLLAKLVFEGESEVLKENKQKIKTLLLNEWTELQQIESLEEREAKISIFLTSEAIKQVLPKGPDAEESKNSIREMLSVKAEDLLAEGLKAVAGNVLAVLLAPINAHFLKDGKGNVNFEDSYYEQCRQEILGKLELLEKIFFSDISKNIVDKKLAEIHKNLITVFTNFLTQKIDAEIQFPRDDKAKSAALFQNWLGTMKNAIEVFSKCVTGKEFLANLASVTTDYFSEITNLFKINVSDIPQIVQTILGIQQRVKEGGTDAADASKALLPSKVVLEALIIERAADFNVIIESLNSAVDSFLSFSTDNLQEATLDTTLTSLATMQNALRGLDAITKNHLSIFVAIDELKSAGIEIDVSPIKKSAVEYKEIKAKIEKFKTEKEKLVQKIKGYFQETQVQEFCDLLTHMEEKISLFAQDDAEDLNEQYKSYLSIPLIDILGREQDLGVLQEIAKTDEDFVRKLNLLRRHQEISSEFAVLPEIIEAKQIKEALVNLDGDLEKLLLEAFKGISVDAKSSEQLVKLNELIRLQKSEEVVSGKFSSIMSDLQAKHKWLLLMARLDVVKIVNMLSDAISSKDLAVYLNKMLRALLGEKIADVEFSEADAQKIKQLFFHAHMEKLQFNLLLQSLLLGSEQFKTQNRLRYGSTLEVIAKINAAWGTKDFAKVIKIAGEQLGVKIDLSVESLTILDKSFPDAFSLLSNIKQIFREENFDTTVANYVSEEIIDSGYGNFLKYIENKIKGLEKFKSIKAVGDLLSESNKVKTILNVRIKVNSLRALLSSKEPSTTNSELLRHIAGLKENVKALSSSGYTGNSDFRHYTEGLIEDIEKLQEDLLSKLLDNYLDISMPQEGSSVYDAIEILYFIEDKIKEGHEYHSGVMLEKLQAAKGKCESFVNPRLQSYIAKISELIKQESHLEAAKFIVDLINSSELTAGKKVGADELIPLAIYILRTINPQDFLAFKAALSQYAAVLGSNLGKIGNVTASIISATEYLRQQATETQQILEEPVTPKFSAKDLHLLLRGIGVSGVNLEEFKKSLGEMVESLKGPDNKELREALQGSLNSESAFAEYSEFYLAEENAEWDKLFAEKVFEILRDPKLLQEAVFARETLELGTRHQKFFAFDILGDVIDLVKIKNKGRISVKALSYIPQELQNSLLGIEDTRKRIIIDAVVCGAHNELIGRMNTVLGEVSASDEAAMQRTISMYQDIPKRFFAHLLERDGQADMLKLLQEREKPYQVPEAFKAQFENLKAAFKKIKDTVEAVSSKVEAVSSKASPVSFEEGKKMHELVMANFKDFNGRHTALLAALKSYEGQDVADWLKITEALSAEARITLGEIANLECSVADGLIKRQETLLKELEVTNFISKYFLGVQTGGDAGEAYKELLESKLQEIESCAKELKLLQQQVAELNLPANSSNSLYLSQLISRVREQQGVLSALQGTRIRDVRGVSSEPRSEPVKDERIAYGLRERFNSYAKAALVVLLPNLNLDSQLPEVLGEVQQMVGRLEKNLGLISNEKDFESYLYRLVEVMSKYTHQKPARALADLNIAEGLYSAMKLGAQALCTVTAVNGGGAIIQIDTPLSYRYTEVQVMEYLSVLKPQGQPKWFRDLPTFAQKYLQEKLGPVKEAFDSGVIESAQYELGRVIGVLPTTIRKLPGMANYMLHTATILAVDRNVMSVVAETQNVRASTLSPIGMKDKAEQLKVATDNLEQVVRTHYDMLVARLKAKGLSDPQIERKLTEEIPILVQSLVTPLRPDFTHESEMVEVKEAAIAVLREKIERGEITIKVGSKDIPIKPTFISTNHPINKYRKGLLSILIKSRDKENLEAADVLVKLAGNYLESHTDDALLSNALEVYKDLMLDGKHKEMKRDENLFRGALELIIIDRMDGLGVSGCKSGKDRRGMEGIYADAMLEYFAIEKKFPSPDDSSGDRKKFVDIIVSLFKAGHAQELAALNSAGVRGLKSLKGGLPEDVVKALGLDFLEENKVLSAQNKPKLQGAKISSIVALFKAFFRRLFRRLVSDIPDLTESRDALSKLQQQQAMGMITVPVDVSATATTSLLATQVQGVAEDPSSTVASSSESVGKAGNADVQAAAIPAKISLESASANKTAAEVREKRADGRVGSMVGTAFGTILGSLVAPGPGTAIGAVIGGVGGSAVAQALSLAKSDKRSERRQVVAARTAASTFTEQQIIQQKQKPLPSLPTKHELNSIYDDWGYENDSVVRGSKLADFISKHKEDIEKEGGVKEFLQKFGFDPNSKEALIGGFARDFVGEYDKHAIKSKDTKEPEGEFSAVGTSGLEP